jgi:two-component system, cell cycle response regulator
MEKFNKFDSYNIKAIIALNDHLKTLKKFDDIFKYISSHLKKNFNIEKFTASVSDRLVYMSFTDTKENLIDKSFLITLNGNSDLKITIFYSSNQEKEILDIFDIIKTIFSIVSQTIYTKYLEFKMDEMSIKDSLTGLYNRQYVDEYLRTTLPLSSRERKKMAFLKVGIDHFKAVIDEFDYTIGDKVLKELAQSLESSVRKTDIIARVDSDEFLIILHNVISENNAIIVAEKIIENFKSKKVVVNEKTNQTLMKTISTGISIFPDDANKIEEIFRTSDIALYEAKNKGRSQFFKFKKSDNNTIELF